MDLGARPSVKGPKCKCADITSYVEDYRGRPGIECLWKGVRTFEDLIQPAVVRRALSKL